MSIKDKGKPSNNSRHQESVAHLMSEWSPGVPHYMRQESVAHLMPE